MGKLRHSKRDGSNSTGYGCSKGSTRMNNTGGLSRSSVGIESWNTEVGSEDIAQFGKVLASA